MKVEATITAPSSIDELIMHGRQLDELGYDTILVPEAGHDPFLPAMILAEHTKRAKIGTGIAVAFPRSPFVTAQLAWDLQRFSGGRFLLGLGTQVKGHNERRYSTPWPSPAGPRLREYVLCLQAIFKTFQNVERPVYFRGKHYRFELITPFFSPGPNAHEKVPIYLAAVNEYNCRLVGEVADGIRLHPLNTARYIREVVRPAIEQGAAKTGRSIDDVDIVANPFAITGNTREELEASKKLIRKHLSFYAATRTYFRVLEHHGWGATGQELYEMSTRGRWDEMATRISDDMLDELAVVGTFDELPDRVRERYGGIATTVNLVFGPPYQELQSRQRQMFQEFGRVLPRLRDA
jgi:probable F420-dependent oxidoreductase